MIGRDREYRRRRIAHRSGSPGSACWCDVGDRGGVAIPGGIARELGEVRVARRVDAVIAAHESDARELVEEDEHDGRLARHGHVRQPTTSPPGRTSFEVGEMTRNTTRKSSGTGDRTVRQRAARRGCERRRGQRAHPRRIASRSAGPRHRRTSRRAAGRRTQRSVARRRARWSVQARRRETREASASDADQQQRCNRPRPQAPDRMMSPSVDPRRHRTPPHGAVRSKVA